MRRHRGSSRAQFVHSQLATLHHQRNPLALTRQARQVGERVAIDQQQVGARPGRRLADLAALAQQLGADQGGALQHLHQGVEMALVDVHVGMGRFHISAFIFARAAAQLADLVGQALLEGDRFGVLEVAANARVLDHAVHKIVHQAGDARLFAQGLVQACRGGWGGSPVVKWFTRS